MEVSDLMCQASHCCVEVCLIKKLSDHEVPFAGTYNAKRITEICILQAGDAVPSGPVRQGAWRRLRLEGSCGVHKLHPARIKQEWREGHDC